MKKGALIGVGMTAEVFEWGPDKVIKLFFSRYDFERIKYEAEITSRVHEIGIPSPSVEDIINIEGRTGIIFQRIFGKSILENLRLKPWKLNYYSQKLAQLQFQIHQTSSSKLPSQKERLALNIGMTSQRLGDKEKEILDYLEGLPDGFSVCHGDLHFNNVIVTERGLVAVDWNSAYTGNPSGDAARTFLMMKSQESSRVHNISDFALRYVRRLARKTYIKNYMDLSDVNYAEIDAWMLPVAAAKLKDHSFKEQKWLMDIIDRRLNKIK